ncbi:iron-siderophore ABC transporter substrate-binding protein [Sciscionella marina]|uniref:ABC transporter substrate-binding protein n=1 Tax=Sciscionella marina TaxID=508770 RepID=UPI0003803D20|nr:iron-siderophore ABC transporter substrate-binding protein [Sciscionella marina]
MSHRTVIAAVFTCLVVLLTAGCGTSPDTPSGPGHQLTDATGKRVTVPSRPSRVVTLSESTLDGALALGVRPVATSGGRGQPGVPAYLAERAKGIPLVGALASPSLEKITEARPDLILTDGTALKDTAVLDKLRAIAPLAYVREAGADWRQAFTMEAEALNKAGRARTVLADFDRGLAATKGGLGNNGGSSVTIVRWTGKGPQLILREQPAGRIVSELGLRRPPAQDKDGPGHSVPVSLENLDQLDADWIFFGALGGGGRQGANAKKTTGDVGASQKALRQASAVPGFDRLHAVAAHHVVPVDGSAWTSAGGVLACTRILEDIGGALK